MITSYFKPKPKDDSSSSSVEPKVQSNRDVASVSAFALKKKNVIDNIVVDSDVEKENKRNTIVAAVTPNQTIKTKTEAIIPTTSKFQKGQSVKKVRCLLSGVPLWSTFPCL